MIEGDSRRSDVVSIDKVMVKVTRQVSRQGNDPSTRTIGGEEMPISGGEVGFGTNCQDYGDCDYGAYLKILTPGRTTPPKVDHLLEDFLRGNVLMPLYAFVIL